uniref:Protein unc-45 homolog B n=1 Tax=Aureoumbra lagunensis TaxID=44058 RepID=A0A7S3JQE0_9STRA|mmetsp:Transcript_18002/g.27105  ORF Transcript_18002/g.27105 Transcript_18002/m.27105 type:complete len:1036 (+) Transcript_18002:46-3153(+)
MKASGGVESKDEGNRLFSQGKYEEAIEVYNRALTEAFDPQLKCTIFTNRAACAMKLNRWEECVSDCDVALRIDGGRVKALYRRAFALAAIGKDIERACFDAVKAAKLDPKNKEAIKLARELKAKVTKDMERRGAYESPIMRAARRILGQSDNDTMTLPDALKNATSIVATDGSEAITMWRCGACGAAVNLIINEENELAILACRFLASCCLTLSVAIDIKQLFPLAKCKHLNQLVSQDVALLAVAARVADELTAHKDEEERNDNLVQLEKRFVAESICTALNPLKEKRQKWLDAALDVLVRWLGPIIERLTPESEVKLKKLTTTKAKREAVQKRQIDIEKRRRNACARLAEFALTDDYDTIWLGIWALLDAQNDNLRLKAHATLARILKATATPTPLGAEHGPYEFDKSAQNDMSVSDLLEKILDTGDDCIELKTKQADENLNISDELRFRRKKAALVASFSLASGYLGAKALQRCFESPLVLLQVIESRDIMAEKLAAECLANAAACQEGRAFLAPLVAAGTLEALASDESKTKNTRSAAAAATARLGLAANALKAGSQETGRLLSAALALCKRGPNDDYSVEDAAARDRGLEVLAALSADSNVKEEIAHGSGRLGTGSAIDILCTQVGSKIKGNDPSAYALISIFANLTVTNNELRQRHFRERDMDITPEQYDELMRVTKQKAEEDADNDTEALASRRRRKLVLADGGAIISQIILSDPPPSLQTRRKLAETLCQLSVDVELRGVLIQQGALRAAVALCNEENKEEEEKDDVLQHMRVHAGHACARMLITTDPHKLPDATAYSAIRPLLWTCKQVAILDIIHFEACLALTNLITLGHDAKRRVAQARGINTLEYLQFSDHKLIQRAATEALTNMVPDPDFLAHLKKKDKLKLWLAFATELPDEDDEELDDKAKQEALALPRAATGCLAMVTEHDDEELALCLSLIKEKSAPDALIELVSYNDPAIVHRAAVLITNLAHDRRARRVLLKVVPTLEPTLRTAMDSTFANVSVISNALGAAIEAIQTPIEGEPTAA